MSNIQELHLRQAIIMGKTETIKSMLMNGASLNYKHSGKTLFETAMRSASSNVAEAILSIDSRGFSKLHLVCLRNDIVGLKNIMECNHYAKACINDYISWESPDWPGFTPLHFAVIYSCLEIVEILLDNGASVSCLNAKLMSPLHYVIKKIKHRRQILRSILLKFIKKECKTIDCFGLTLVHVVTILNDPSLLKSCLQMQGTEVDAHVDPTSSLWSNWTALHVAARYNRLKAAEVLLWHGADVAADGGHGKTPFHLAHQYGNKKMVDLMLPFLDGLSNPIDSNGLSHLHIASSRKDPTVVQRLLFGGANAAHRVWDSSQIWPGLSSLEVALRFDRASIAVALASCSSPDAMDLLASRRVLRRRGAYRALERLLDEGLYRADGAAAAVGDTPLQYACKRGFVELAVCLLKHGAQPNRCGRNSATPLQLALLYRHESLIKLLIDSGADLYHTTELDCSNALDYLISTIVFRRGLTRSSLERYYYKVISWFIEAGLDTVDINRAMRRSAINPIAVWALLQHGADVNAVGRNGKTTLWHYFRGSSCFGDNLGNYIIFREHLQKLRTIGLPISPENEALFHKMHLRYERDYVRSVRFDLKEQCELELEKLKRTHLTQYTTLYDIVFKSPNAMTLLVKNDSLRKILMAEDFDDQYPMYGFLLRLQFRRGSLRRTLLQSAQEVLQLCTDYCNIPDSCFFEIFTYLSNEDLRNLAKARMAT